MTGEAVDMSEHEVGSASMPSRSGAALPARAILSLPPPQKDAATTLCNALALRRSTREYSERILALQALSNLLWAAYGVNRPGGGRTAPYWRHIMVIDILVAMAGGVWRYEPEQNTLLPHLSGDIRAQTGLQDFVGVAPIDLIYVAHGERMSDLSRAERRLYASVDAAFIGQNVYLHCAAAGLGTVFRAAIDYAKLTRSLNLPPEQFVTFAQTVGYPQTGG